MFSPTEQIYRHADGNHAVNDRSFPLSAYDLGVRDEQTDESNNVPFETALSKFAMNARVNDKFFMVHMKSPNMIVEGQKVAAVGEGVLTLKPR